MINTKQYDFFDIYNQINNESVDEIPLVFNFWKTLVLKNKDKRRFYPLLKMYDLSMKEEKLSYLFNEEKHSYQKLFEYTISKNIIKNWGRFNKDTLTIDKLINIYIVLEVCEDDSFGNKDEIFKSLDNVDLLVHFIHELIGLVGMFYTLEFIKYIKPSIREILKEKMVNA